VLWKWWLEVAEEVGGEAGIALLRGGCRIGNPICIPKLSADIVRRFTVSFIGKFDFNE
jgi:hypothetical protein